jgi:MFS transporter, BCD family, chlorophyll transporter
MKLSVSSWNQRAGRFWQNVGPQFLPFADAVSPDFPAAKLVRLTLFQFSIGLCTALMIGTLNRILIVELGVSAWLVAIMVALPIVSAPFRALMGYKSDNYRSVLGWRRVPYIWSGSLMMFGGLAIMPFAIVLLSQGTGSQHWIGLVASVAAFVLTGAGIQMTQTAGLALAGDLANDQTRPRVVALMYVMLLIGMLASGLVLSWLLEPFSNTRLVQVVQGCAVVCLVLNLVASWKQEARKSGGYASAEGTLSFKQSWQHYTATPNARRFLVAVGLGSAAFSMQDVILEPYGAQVLGMTVSATTVLTAIMACGAVLAFVLAGRLLTQGWNAYRLACMGLVIGLPGFSLVIFAEPFGATSLFKVGTFLIGIGGGLFSVATLAAAMRHEGKQTQQHNGLALGAWGAVQASCAGVAMAIGGAIRDLVNVLAMNGQLGEALINRATGYSFVYHIELALLFAALIVMGPLAKFADESNRIQKEKFGLSDLPT